MTGKLGITFSHVGTKTNSKSLVNHSKQICIFAVMLIKLGFSYCVCFSVLKCYQHMELIFLYSGSNNKSLPGELAPNRRLSFESGCRVDMCTFEVDVQVPMTCVCMEFRSNLSSSSCPIFTLVHIILHIYF